MQAIEQIKPVAWVGEDRLVLKDITRYGLNRRVIARKNVEPDVEAWLAVCEKEANGAEVWGCLVQVENFYVLWIVWKERP